MNIDWTVIDLKREQLGRSLYPTVEKRGLEQDAAKILGVDPSHRDEPWGRAVGYGARSIALIQPAPSVPTRFSNTYGNQVLVKLFNGRGKPGRAADFLSYHGQSFSQIDALGANRHLQQSLEAGSTAQNTHYAILSCLEGTLFRDYLSASHGEREVKSLLKDLFLRIWIPLWAAGLRFKDCHPGNFMTTESMQLVMIDTEQMRKDAFELLTEPNTWTQRDRHGKSGLSKIPKLLETCSQSYGRKRSVSQIKKWDVYQALCAQFTDIGRENGSTGAAEMCAEELINTL
jgi:hypothetical protein